MKVTLIVIASALVISMALFLLFTYRFNTPGTIGLLGKDNIRYGTNIIVCPIVVNSVKTGYYADGGTIMATFIDAAGTAHQLCEDARMGTPYPWRDVYINATHPRREKAIFIGDDIISHKIIFELLLMDKTLTFGYGPRILEIRYPTLIQKIMR